VGDKVISSTTITPSPHHSLTPSVLHRVTSSPFPVKQSGDKNMTPRKILLIGPLVLAALACNVTGGLTPLPINEVATSVAATQTALAGVVTPTERATETSVPPTSTSETVPTSESPATNTPAPGETPPPQANEQEAILILEPSLNASGISSVTSPVHVSGQSDPAFEQSIVVEVTDQNGAVVGQVPTQIQADVGQRGPFSADVTFKINEDQPGRISVYMTSARDGGVIHLSSVEVMLLASGSASIVPGQPRPEFITIFNPAFLAHLSGGNIHVTGFSDYVFESQLGVKLCGEGGSGAADPICGTVDNVLGEGVAMLNVTEMGQPGPFAGDVAYKISGPMPGRVVVFEASPRDGGLTHVSTVEVMLEP
jgi:hypothetical protein